MKSDKISLFTNPRSKSDFQSILFKSIAILFAILKWKCIAILQFCNIAPPEKVLQYCNTSILFTERKPIIHKFYSAYIGVYWKTLVPKSLSRDFNRFLTEFWWYLQVYLNFSNFPIQFYIWKTKKQCHFLKYCVSILLNFLQYCTTAILHFWKVMQYCKNPEKVLQYWNAILQYCNTESLILWYYDFIG